jgi:hypothetical protein
MRLTERLPIRLIPEQSLVATMSLDMVDYRCLYLLLMLGTHDAVWV